MGTTHTKVLIIGSGGNAVSPAVYLTKAGITDYRILTKHRDFGGAWFQNTYPGCEVDSPSVLYQFSFNPNSNWSRLYAPQAEVMQYMQDTARRFGLYEKTDFEVEFLGARWDQDDSLWHVETTGGPYRAEFLVLATGFLEEPVFPRIPGQDRFQGRVFHSSMWPEGYTGAGDRVAVVGTGSSGIQILCEMQKVARQVYLFQRTPTWVLPKNNREIAEDEREEYRRKVLAAAEFGGEEFGYGEDYWATVYLGANPDKFEDLAKQHLRTAIGDEALRQSLTPDHRYGCKRPPRSDDYYPTLACDNVRLVNGGARAFGARSLIGADGAEYEVDTVVLATGFFFGGHILERVRRRDGMSVADYHAGHPKAYKSVSLSGCPNLILSGGAAPNGQIWNGLFSGEAASRYLVLLLQHMERDGLKAIEVRQEAEERWKRAADTILARGPTVNGGCVNYSQDEQGANKAAWPGSLRDMADQLGTLDASDYIALA